VGRKRDEVRRKRVEGGGRKEGSERREEVCR
jgi:hypothetical protein